MREHKIGRYDWATHKRHNTLSKQNEFANLVLGLLYIIRFQKQTKYKTTQMISTMAISFFINHHFHSSFI